MQMEENDRGKQSKVLFSNILLPINTAAFIIIQDFLSQPNPGWTSPHLQMSGPPSSWALCWPGNSAESWPSPHPEAPRKFVKLDQTRRRETVWSLDADHNRGSLEVNPLGQHARISWRLSSLPSSPAPTLQQTPQLLQRRRCRLLRTWWWLVRTNDAVETQAFSEFWKLPFINEL